jgi:hypothetical protein
MPIDLLQLPPPCRSGRFCETCRDAMRGLDFRAMHAATHPEMYGPRMECNFGLPWEHKGPAPWADQFTQMIRAQMQNAAADEMAAQSTFGPGDVVKLLLAKIGYRPHANCGCEAFRQQMNTWGWRGCLRRRKEIIDWFASKAREQGLHVEHDQWWSLIRAGMKDLLARRGK